MVRTYTARLELEDDPAELRQALDAMATEGGNVCSISYDRRDVTPRGRVGADLVFEVEPDRLRPIVAGWSERGIDVVHAERERKGESLTLTVEASPTDAATETALEYVSERGHVSVSELSWRRVDGDADRSYTRLLVVADPGGDGDPLGEVRRFAEERQGWIVGE